MMSTSAAGVSVTLNSLTEGYSFKSVSSETTQSRNMSHMESTQSQTAVENLEDYETQLFGFTPKSFVSGIYNAVSEYFMEALQILEDFLQNKYLDTMTASEVGERMTFIRKHLVTQIDKAFDTLETYLSTNIFCVPAGVVLPEDQVQVDTPVSQQDFLQVQQDIDGMKKKILAVKLANSVLKQRLQYTMELQETFDSFVEHLNTAQATTRKGGVVDLHDSLSHCAQTILATLRTVNNIQVLDPEKGPTQAKKKKSSLD